jgi:acyl-CoA dehydrogenase
VARRVPRGYRPHEEYWPTEYIPAKRDNARRRMRSVLDACPNLGRSAEKYAARRSTVARLGIAVLRWADA